MSAHIHKRDVQHGIQPVGKDPEVQHGIQPVGKDPEVQHGTLPAPDPDESSTVGIVPIHAGGDKTPADIDTP